MERAELCYTCLLTASPLGLYCNPLQLWLAPNASLCPGRAHGAEEGTLCLLNRVNGKITVPPFNLLRLQPSSFENMAGPFAHSGIQTCHTVYKEGGLVGWFLPQS